MNKNINYHLKKADELITNKDPAAFDHAWLFIKSSVESCFHRQIDDNFKFENANVEIINIIPDHDMQEKLHEVRKKRNLYQHGKGDFQANFTGNDFHVLKKTIKDFIAYINQHADSNDQIKYDVGLFRQEHISKLSKQKFNLSASDTDAPSKHIKFEYDFSPLHNHEETFSFFNNNYNNNNNQVLYAIGYGDSDKYLLTANNVPYISKQPILSVVFNILIRSSTIPISQIIKREGFSRNELELVFAFELLILQAACSSEGQGDLIFRVQQENLNYAICATNDILYYASMLSEMSNVDYPSITIVVSDHLEQQNLSLYLDNSTDTIFLSDYLNNTYSARLTDTDPPLRQGSIMLSSHINYSVTNKNVAFFILLMNEIFGYDNFRDGQLSTIKSIFDDDANHLVVLPTGYGKSLIYQFLAIIQPQISVIISPTPILIHDQIENLKDAGITRVKYESGERMDYSKAKLNLKATSNIIYVLPETIQRECWFVLLKEAVNKSILNFISIDECHQMSVWGHSFKPEYFTLIGQLNSELPDAQFLLFSATSSLRVKEDLKLYLNGKYLKVIQPCPLKRDNIHYELKSHKDISSVAADILNIFVRDYNSGRDFDVSDANAEPSLSMIICNNNCVQKFIFDFLRRSNDIGSYVSIFSGEINIYNRFRLANKRIIITDDAYLAGININFLRNIFIVGFPPSKEWMYQETGRVGRNGEQSNVIIYLSNDPAESNSSLLNVEYGTAKDFDSRNNFSFANMDSLFSFITSEDEVKETCQIFNDIKRYVYVFDNQKYGTVTGKMSTSEKELFDKPLFILYQMNIIKGWLLFSDKPHQLSDGKLQPDQIKYRFFINMEIREGTLPFEQYFCKHLENDSTNINIADKYRREISSTEEDFFGLIKVFSSWISENIFTNKHKMLMGTYALVSDIPNSDDFRTEITLCKYFGVDSDKVATITPQITHGETFKLVDALTRKKQSKSEDRAIHQQHDGEKKGLNNISNKVSSTMSKLEIIDDPNDDNIDTNSYFEDLTCKQAEPISIDNMIHLCREKNVYQENLLIQFLDLIKFDSSFETLAGYEAILERENEYKENATIIVLLATVEAVSSSKRTLRLQALLKEFSITNILEFLNVIENSICCTKKKCIDNLLHSNNLKKYYFPGLLGQIKYLFCRLFNR